MRAPWTGSGTFTPGDLIAVVAESKTLSFGAAQRGGRARDARADRGGAVAGYRAAQPPADREQREGEGGVCLASGRRVISLADVLEVCLEDGVKGVP
jgi:hypothetical protein